jgi:hypothetical protein
MHFLSWQEAKCRESDLGRFYNICCNWTASWATTGSLRGQEGL